MKQIEEVQCKLTECLREAQNSINLEFKKAGNDTPPCISGKQVWLNKKNRSTQQKQNQEENGIIDGWNPFLFVNRYQYLRTNSHCLYLWKVSTQRFVHLFYANTSQNWLWNNNCWIPSRWGSKARKKEKSTTSLIYKDKTTISYTVSARKYLEPSTTHESQGTACQVFLE